MDIQRRFSSLRGLPLRLSLSSAALWRALVFLGCLVVYLNTLTQAHTFDALSYALDVDTKPWQELFHPHHLAYGPLGALVGALARGAGWQGGVVVPLQVVNAVAGAFGVALFFELVYSVLRRIDVALCAALLLGSSYAYWYYAVEVEVYTIAAVFLIVCLWLLVAILRSPVLSLRTCVALGAVQGVAVLFHQTNMLLCVPVAIALLLASGKQQTAGASRAVWWPWLAYALPLALVVGGAYLLVGFGISGFRSWGELVAWMTAYARTGWWGGTSGSDFWADLGTGLSSALAHPAGALLGWLLVGLVVLLLRRVALRYWRLVLCLGAWLLVYGGFFAWWEPDNAEFWIASFPPALLLLALALTAGGPRWHPGVWLTLAIGLAMVVGNYQAVMLRGSGAYAPQIAIAHALAEASEPGDLLLVPDGLQELYLQYNEQRVNSVSLSQLLQRSAGDWEAACERVHARIETSLAQGAAVLIGESVLQPSLVNPLYSDPLVERFNLDQERVTACFAPYLSDLTALEIGPGLPTYYRLPSAQELLAGDGWHFEHSTWGWQAHNALNERFEYYDGEWVWSFLPEPDPFVLSPRVEIDTSRYWAVQLRVAKWVANREAQLFWMDDRGIIEEERSVRWELANHADLKTYHLDLRDHPAWAGEITRLRIDISTGPDEDEGERVYIAWVRLLSYADDPPDD
jgi:hypothetical protein